MNRPRMPRVPAARRRDDQRENLLTTGVVIITIAIVGMLLPTTATERSPYSGPLLWAIIASVVIGNVLSIRLIEHRRPWPFGPRRTHGPYAVPETLTAVLV